MELLSISIARSIWILSFTDLNPRGRHLSSLYPALIERYKFGTYPKTLDEFDPQEGLKLQAGLFQTSLNEPIAVDLTTYNDGFVADSRSSTSDSDLFLEDIFMWLHQEFNFSYYKEILRRKIYASELYVRMERNLKIANPELEKFARSLSLNTPGDESISFEIGGVSFWADPAKAMGVSTFRLERAEGKPFKENRYYSSAPVQTENHLELLEELEKILTS